MNWDSAFEEVLLEAPSYRGFLRCFFEKEPARKSPRPVSYQELAQRSDLASKGYLYELVNGKKNMTLATCKKICNGLKLDHLWEEYFRLMAGLEKSELLPGGVSAASAQKRLEKLRQKILARRQSQHVQGDSPLVRVFLAPHFPEVYAALGTIQDGSSFADIQSKTQLDAEILTDVLKDLELAGLLRRESEALHYYPISSAFDASELSDSAILREDFFRSSSKARRRFTAQANSPSSLFMTQTFSVHSNRLPELQKILALTISQFAEQAEDPAGDTVAEVCISFTNTMSEAQTE